MDLENNVSCYICTLDFTGMQLDISKLKQLSCGHIFCKNCINDIIKHSLQENPAQKLDSLLVSVIDITQKLYSGSGIRDPEEPQNSIVPILRLNSKFFFREDMDNYHVEQKYRHS